MGNKSSTPQKQDSTAPQTPTETTQVQALPTTTPVIVPVTPKVDVVPSQVKSQPSQVQKVEDKIKDAAHTVVEKAKETKETVKHAIEDAHLTDKTKSTAETLKQTASSASGDLHYYLKEGVHLTRGYYNEAKSNFETINREGPLAIADIKKNYIFKMDPTTRMFIFGGTTALTFLLSAKLGGFRSTIKNTIFMGLTSSFFIYPEAINPFYKIHYQIAEEQEE